MTYTEPFKWLLWNADLLSRIFGSRRVFLDGTHWQFLEIRDFPLPENWWQSNSRLLMRFPNITQIFAIPPDHFYLDKGLRTSDWKVPDHYYESGEIFNDLSSKGYARYSFHIDPKSWYPSRIPYIGSTLVDVLDSLNDSLTEAAG